MTWRADVACTALGMLLRDDTDKARHALTGLTPDDLIAVAQAADRLSTLADDMADPA